ncbi:hypothetical protein [Ponticaulis profundi]|uniref:Uncharacterized protein n=1 Tax=Ponticaulis profundi TaxID=2665222 RepID=A0ABW1S875_9PROT
MDRNYLDEKSVTDLGRMLMALMSEVWILKDRTMLLEHVLETRGGIAKDELENMEIPEDLAAKIDAERDKFATLVLSAPIAGEKRSVKDILERAGLKDSPVLANAD